MSDTMAKSNKNVDKTKIYILFHGIYNLITFFYLFMVFHWKPISDGTRYKKYIVKNVPSTETCIWVISPGNVHLPVNVVVSIILALASLMSNIFLIQTPITIFDRFLAWWECIGFTVFHDSLVLIFSPAGSYLGPNNSLLTFRRHFNNF